MKSAKIYNILCFKVQPYINLTAIKMFATFAESK
jgi:hypothetical protein